MANDPIRRGRKGNQQEDPSYDDLGVPTVPSTEDLYKTTEQKADWNSKISGASQKQTRQQQIDNLLREYQSAKNKQRLGKTFTGISARSMALTNPAAARVIMQTQGPLDSQKSDMIGQKLGLQKQKLANIGQMQQVQMSDQDMDSNSPQAIVARRILDQQYGIKVPQQSTYRHMKQVFPFIKADVDRDTRVRGQDLTAQTAEQNRLSKQKQKQLDRDAAQTRTETLVGGGIDKAIVTGTMNQNQRSGGGSGSASGNQRIATALTLPYPMTVFGQEGTKFLVKKPGMPADPRIAQDVWKMNSQATKYAGSLGRLQRLVQDASQGVLNANVFDATWPQIQSAFNDAIQANVKFKGNGVANGPDIERAIATIGDINSFMDWVRGGSLKKIKQAKTGILNDLNNIYRDSGFAVSDKPHPQDPTQVGQGYGSGGSQSGPVYDVTGAVQETFKKRGLTPPTKNSPKAKTPEKTTSPAQPASPDSKAKAQEALRKMGF